MCIYLTYEAERVEVLEDTERDDRARPFRGCRPPAVLEELVYHSREITSTVTNVNILYAVEVDDGDGTFLRLRVGTGEPVVAELEP